MPTIDEASPEEQIRRIGAIALAGDHAQWGSAIGVYHALGGFCDYLGIQSLIDAREIDRGVLAQAAWICLHAATSRPSVQSVSIIRRCIKVADYLLGDFASVATMNSHHVRKIVRAVTREPVPALTIMQCLGAADVRPKPSGISAALLTRIACLDWTSFLLARGSEAPRLAAMEFLESREADVFFAVEYWGSLLCPESCNGGAEVCPAREFCYAHERGLVQECLL